MHPDPRTADATLVRRAQNGDTAAFELLVRRYQETLYRTALQILRDRGDARDATQEALLMAWRKLPELAEPATFRVWLHRIAIRRALNIVRGRRPHALLDAEDVHAGPAADPERRSVDAGLRAALAAALAALPPPQRACWVLRELEGLGYAEIAELVDATPGAVRGRIHRARTHLVEMLRPWR